MVTDFGFPLQRWMIFYTRGFDPIHCLSILLQRRSTVHFPFPNSNSQQKTLATNYLAASVHRLLFGFEFLFELTEDRSIKDANK